MKNESNIKSNNEFFNDTTKLNTNLDVKNEDDGSNIK
jgi:hypothetical protein